MLVSDAVRSEGAARFGVDLDSLQLLKGTDGRIYSCRQGSRAGLLKFDLLPVTRLPQYAERIKFVRYLVDHGAPVTPPLASTLGNLFETVPLDELDNIQVFLVSLTPYASGRHPSARNPYDWNERFFQAWGKVTGQLHALSHSYPDGANRVADTQACASPGDPQPQMADWQDEYQFFMNWSEDPKVNRRLAALWDEFCKLPCDRACYGLIHNDLQPDNLFYNPDARDGVLITLNNFDACAYHWYINDIACALYSAISQAPGKTLAQRQSSASRFLPSFLLGYRQENELDDTWLRRLPLFLKYREIIVYTALSHEWPEENRGRWQNAILAEKHARILRDEPLLT